MYFPNKRLSHLAVGLLSICGLVAVARADTIVAYNDVSLIFHPVGNVWSTDAVGGFDDTALPDGTTFGLGNTLIIDLKLANKLTLGNDINFGFGLSGFDPVVQPSDLMFEFAITLRNGGMAISNPFGFLLNNPFDFAIDNVITSSSTTITGGVFDEIYIEVNGPAYSTGITSFAVNVGNQNVPDGGATFALVGLGMLGLGFSRKRLVRN